MDSDDDDEGVSMAKPLSVVMNAILMKKAVTRTPPPPPVMVKPGIRYPILNPTDKEGFFAVASLILHADLDTESGVIETCQCPQGLRLIGKNNLGCPNYIPGKFTDIVMCIMLNQIEASVMIEEISKLNKAGIDIFLQKTTTKTFDDMCRSQSSCDAELTQTKAQISEEGTRMKNHIDELTKNARRDCIAGDTATILASVIELNDQCILLQKSLRCSVDSLFKTVSSHYASEFANSNHVSWNAHSVYLCDKTYSLDDPFPSLNKTTATPLDHFSHDYLMGHLHLAVGLRLGGAVYTVQANVNLKELKQTTHFNHNKVTLHEIVTVLMNQHMRKRVVDLMCEEHSTLNNKEVKKNMGELTKTNWDVAVVDFGCTNIAGPSDCPQILHMPTPNDNPTKRKVVMGVVNAPARLPLGETYMMNPNGVFDPSAQPHKYVKVSQGAAEYLPREIPNKYEKSELFTSVEEVPAPAPPSPPPKSLTDPSNFDPDARRKKLKRTFSTLARSDYTPKAPLSDSEGGKRTRRPRQPRQPTRQPRQPRQPRRTTRRRSMRTRTRKSRMK